MYALFKKEISNFLSSLIGIMVIVVFLLITGLFLWVFQSDFNVLNFGYANLDSLFVLAPWVFLFLVPAVTMRRWRKTTQGIHNTARSQANRCGSSIQRGFSLPVCGCANGFRSACA